jgi:hypothetical protein
MVVLLLAVAEVANFPAEAATLNLLALGIVAAATAVLM